MVASVYLVHDSVAVAVAVYDNDVYDKDGVDKLECPDRVPLLVDVWKNFAGNGFVAPSLEVAADALGVCVLVVVVVVVVVVVAAVAV